MKEKQGYVHPTTIDEFESVYRREYQEELESCDRWIKWCKGQKDTHGMNFYQGLRGALVFNDIKMCQLLRVLKQEAPNARLCNRSACRQPGANWWNETMQAWYCQPCALAINESTPGLCVRV